MFIKLCKCIIPAFFCSDVIASRKNMAGVNANAYGNFFVYCMDKVAEMFKAVADGCPLSGCCFYEKARFSVCCYFFKFQKALHNAL